MPFAVDTGRIRAPHSYRQNVSMFPKLAPLTGILVLLNVAAYLLMTSLPDRTLALFELWPLGVTFSGVSLFHPWQVVTYAFMHGSPSHIFLNMLALFMFGSDIERLLGPRRYLVYYFACAIGAAVIQLIVNVIMHSPSPTIGASGAVFGLLLAYGMAFPYRRVLVFAIVPMPVWLFVTVYGVIELYEGITQTQQGVAHFAHLGGMAAGFVLIQYWRLQRRR
jgi:membrane associated rhomboid family serine protease